MYLFLAGRRRGCVGLLLVRRGVGAKKFLGESSGSRCWAGRLGSVLGELVVKLVDSDGVECLELLVLQGVVESNSFVYLCGV